MSLMRTCDRCRTNDSTKFKQKAQLNLTLTKGGYPDESAMEQVVQAEGHDLCDDCLKEVETLLQTEVLDKGGKVIKRRKPAEKPKQPKTEDTTPAAPAAPTGNSESAPSTKPSAGVVAEEPAAPKQPNSEPTAEEPQQKQEAESADNGSSNDGAAEPVVASADTQSPQPPAANDAANSVDPNSTKGNNGSGASPIDSPEPIRRRTGLTPGKKYKLPS